MIELSQANGVSIMNVQQQYNSGNIFDLNLLRNSCNLAIEFRTCHRLFHVSPPACHSWSIYIIVAVLQSLHHHQSVFKSQLEMFILNSNDLAEIVVVIEVLNLNNIMFCVFCSLKYT